MGLHEDHQLVSILASVTTTFVVVSLLPMLFVGDQVMPVRVLFGLLLVLLGAVGYTIAYKAWRAAPHKEKP